jgi:hypothetical protein
MPRKIRQLKADLRRAGFHQIAGRGKGDHTWWEHPMAPGAPVNLDSKDGQDAKPYQEQEVREALRVVAEAEVEAKQRGGQQR